MVILRLRRGGRRKSPHYRIVAQEKRSKLNGAYIESLGHYHPITADKELVVNKERVQYWLSQGAQLSVTVNNLLVKDGVLPKSSKISKVFSKRKPKEDNQQLEATKQVIPEPAAVEKLEVKDKQTNQENQK